MKKFKFRLEVVRLERKRQEDFKLREWSIVNGMLLNLQNELTSLEDSLKNAFSDASNLRAMSTLSIGTISSQESYIEGLKLKIEWKKNDISRAVKFVERKKVEWINARKDRMILDRLKEKKKIDHKKEASRKELQELDDMNVMRAKINSLEDDV